MAKTLAEAAEAGLQQRDQRLLGQFLATGARLGPPRSVSYYLYLPTEPTARLAANDARHANFETQVRPPLSEYPDQWPVIATMADCAFSIDIIKANSAFFDSIVARYQGAYDGWQAVTPR